MPETTGLGLISFMLLVPLVGGILTGFVPESQAKTVKGLAVLFNVVTLVLSLLLLAKFESASYHFQSSEFMPWIKSLGINYRVGVDGISIWLVVLTNFLQLIATIFSSYITKRVKAYFSLMHFLQVAMLGVFVSMDLILFYTFFEASLIPMFFLISIWGGERRKYAAVKFFIYTFAGSIFMLIGMIWMALLNEHQTGILTFDIVTLQQSVANGKLWANAIQLEAWVFWMFALSFMIKCPMFPFHTWLPDAHVEAPTAGSVILAGVLLKMGTYGFLRFCLPMFPDVVRDQVPWLMVLAVIGIIYGAVVSAVQKDVKKLIAYSSVSHMGFVVLGIFSLDHTGIMGGAFQGLNHGVSTGALFLMVGLIYERTHTRLFKDYGGLKAQMPIFSAMFLIVMLSSVGLPGTNGFIGEFLALMGAFQSSFFNLYGLNVGIASIAAMGVILAAVYLLIMFMRVFYGPIKNENLKRLKDLKPWEIGICGALIVMIFWGGLYPNTFLKPMEASAAAARMMAINPEGKRPVWADESLEVDELGNLVQVKRDLGGAILVPFTKVGIIAEAELHPSMQKRSEDEEMKEERESHARLESIR